MGKKPILKVRVYRGTEINYDENRNIKNENHLISIEHGSRNWVLFKKNILLSGYCKVEVEKAFAVKENSEYDEIQDISTYKTEVNDAFTKKVVVNETPEQKKIAELEAKLDALLKKSDKKQDVKEKVAETESDLEAIREEYEKVVGKKPHHMAGVEKLTKEIEKAKK